MERINFIDHNNHRILFLDFSGLQDPGVITEVIKEAKSTIAAQEKDSLLTLTDVSNMSKHPDIARALWQLLKHNKPYVRAAAVIGISSDEELSLYDLLRHQAHRKLELFQSIEQAEDWLVDQ